MASPLPFRRLASLLALLLLLACSHPAFSMPTLPDHLYGGQLGRDFDRAMGARADSEYGRAHAAAAAAAAKPKPKRMFVKVPLDHLNRSDTRTFELKYWVTVAHWSGRPDAPLFITMPSEGPANGVYSDNLTVTFGGIRVAAEHRFFGTSVPCVHGDGGDGGDGGGGGGGDYDDGDGGAPGSCTTGNAVSSPW